MNMPIGLILKILGSPAGCEQVYAEHAGKYGADLPGDLHKQRATESIAEAGTNSVGVMMGERFLQSRLVAQATSSLKGLRCV